MNEYISKNLEKFDIILVLMGRGVNQLATIFCNSEALKKTQKKLLILSGADVPYTDHCNYEYHRLDYEEMDEIWKLYTMYEFSDRFRVLSDHPQYGGLLNYVKTGITTMEEVFQMLLT